MNTLRGIFPEPQPIPKRNFIKENMIHIKRMQGLVNETNKVPSRINKPALEQMDTNKTMKLIRSTKRQLQGLAMLSNDKLKVDKPVHLKFDTEKKSKEVPPLRTAVESFKELEKRKLKEIAIQTEHNSTLRQIYENGTIKYPSPHILSKLNSYKGSDNKNLSPKQIGDGDMRRRSDNFPESAESSRKHDYVKENQMVKANAAKQNATKDPTVAPPTYQKGVVPKYIKDRKEELLRQSKMTEGDEKCPEGHVILPENERKETLRMLRQSYSELVAELNQLPVRSDTLKIRNRKIEIENQLKKLDEGIKVFTRPKVYVKIGA